MKRDMLEIRKSKRQISLWQRDGGKEAEAES